MKLEMVGWKRGKLTDRELFVRLQTDEEILPSALILPRDLEKTPRFERDNSFISKSTLSKIQLWLRFCHVLSKAK